MKIDIKSINTKKYFYPLLLLLLIIPSFFFLLKPGVYWNMHDDMQMIRQLELEKCIKDGQIPCRWSPDLGYGYGYPLFNFYPPMPYIVGQVWRTLGFSFVTAVKLTALTQIIAAAFAMYLLSSLFFGSLGGLIASAFYTYAPYHAVNIYIRGAMNEAWAAVFFPLIFYFTSRLIDQKKIKYVLPLSLSLAGLLLSHNPMVLTFSPILLAWTLYWLIVKVKNLKSFKRITLMGISSAFLALGLTAFYTIPVLVESKYVQIESMFQNYYHYSVHFTSLRQLFISNFWGDGASVWGQEDGMPFMLGYLHWLLPLGIIIYSTVIFIKSKKLEKLLLLPFLISLSGFFAAFMTHERSAFLWGIFTPIQKIQFPWRFLNHSLFLLSLASGYIGVLMLNFKNKYLRYILPTLLLLTLIILNLSYFYPIKSGPITDEQKFSGKAWINQVTSGIYDYLPKTARIAARGPAKEYIDEVYPQNALESLSGQKRGTDWQFFNLKTNRPATIFLSQLAYPGFKVFNYDQELVYEIEPELGRISLNLPAGTHQIYVKLYNTPVRTISNLVSLIVVSGITIYLLIPLWKRLISRK